MNFITLAGAGTYSKVYVTKDKAIKVFELKNPAKSYLNSALELNILFTNNSEHLIKGIDIYTDKYNRLCLETEKCDNVVDKIFENPRIDLKICKKIMKDLALGLKYMHDNNLLHLDIKSENCMYVENESGFFGKIIDFGLASEIKKDQNNKFIEIKTPSKRVTCHYRAYENLKDEDLYVYCNKTDIWSLGIVFYVMLVGDNYFSELKNLKNKKNSWEEATLSYYNYLKENIDKCLKKYVIFELFEEELEKILDLLKNMLNFEKDKRYDINQVLEHEFLVDTMNNEIVKNDYVIIDKDIKNKLKNNKHKFFGVNYIKDICLKNFHDDPAKLMINSINLFINLCSTDFQIVELELTCFCCVLICRKIYILYDEFEDKYFNGEKYWVYENEIICALKGVIIKNDLSDKKYYFNAMCKYFAYFSEDSLSLYINDYLENFENLNLIDVIGYNTNTCKDLSNYIYIFEQNIKYKEKSLKNIFDKLTLQDNFYNISVLTMFVNMYLKSLSKETYIFYDEYYYNTFSEACLKLCIDEPKDLSKNLYDNPYFKFAENLEEIYIFFKEYLFVNLHFSVINYENINLEKRFLNIRQKYEINNPSDKNKSIKEFYTNEIKYFRK